MTLGWEEWEERSRWDGMEDRDGSLVLMGVGAVGSYIVREGGFEG